MKACTSFSTAATRSRNACVYSTAEIAPRAICARALLAESSIRSVLVTTPTSPRRQTGSGRRVRLPPFGAGAGERPHALLVLGKLGGRARINHLAVIEHVSAVGDLYRGTHVLLYEQHGNALLAR